MKKNTRVVIFGFRSFLYFYINIAFLVVVP